MHIHVCLCDIVKSNVCMCIYIYMYIHLSVYTISNSCVAMCCPPSMTPLASDVPCSDELSSDE